MNSKYIKILLVICLAVFISGLFVGTAEAGNLGDKIKDNLLETKLAAELPSTNNPVDVVSTVIKGALGVVAIIFFIVIIVAGFRWMLSGSNEETITKSKKMIQNGIIGLIVIIFSYAITTLVFDLILEHSK